MDYLSRNSGTLALSLSGSTVLDLNLLTQMLAPLKGHPERARRVILELDENQLPETHHLEALIALLGEYSANTVANWDYSTSAGALT